MSSRVQYIVMSWPLLLRCNTISCHDTPIMCVGGQLRHSAAAETPTHTLRHICMDIRVCVCIYGWRRTVITMARKRLLSWWQRYCAHRQTRACCWLPHMRVCLCKLCARVCAGVSSSIVGEVGGHIALSVVTRPTTAHNWTHMAVKVAVDSLFRRTFCLFYKLFSLFLPVLCSFLLPRLTEPNQPNNASERVDKCVT